MAKNFIHDFRDFCEFLSSMLCLYYLNYSIAYLILRIYINYCFYKIILNFICTLFAAINIDLQGIVSFEVNWDLYNKYLTTLQNIELNAKNREVVERGESNVQIWMKTMERVRIFYHIIIYIYKNMNIIFIFRIRQLLKASNYEEKPK